MDWMIALADTWLKKDTVQSTELERDRKVWVPIGKQYKIQEYEERDARTAARGHYRVTLSDGAGEWFVFAEHWQMPWQVYQAPADPLPEWYKINWSDWSAPVSRYFNVGEVTLRSTERIPGTDRVKRNVVAIARELDKVRQWWGGPLAVTSWYRPWHVNKRIGSTSPNHPGGYAVDFYPVGGDVWDLQDRFKAEWYDTGRWVGGFGRGAKDGFVHLDLRHRRTWSY
jgi:Uncharacterized protein conserved in bacteria